MSVFILGFKLIRYVLKVLSWSKTLLKLLEKVIVFISLSFINLS